jgi:DNA-binding NarL/FixJ family response regulator
VTLLLCDDHEMFLDALRDALESRGHEVAASTSDPVEVPTLVARHRPDLVLLDVHLPGMTGVDVARQLRKQQVGTSIVLLTASSEEWVRRAYHDGIVDGLIAKSTDVRTLHRALRQVLGGERVLVGMPRGASLVRRQRTALDQLTPREREVLSLIYDGETNAAIAARLGVSTNTVRTHVAGVLHKLGVPGRTKAATAAVQLGLVPTG